MKKGKARGDTKGAVISFRLTPKDKYAIELIARRDRKSASAVIEQAIATFIDADEISVRPRIPEVLTNEKGKQIDIEIVENSKLENLWSPYPWRRLRKLARFAPELMTNEEKLMWEVIDETDEFWEHYAVGKKRKRKLIPPILRKAWPLLEEFIENYETKPEFDLHKLNKIVKEHRLLMSDLAKEADDIDPSDDSEQVSAEADDD